MRRKKHAAWTPPVNPNETSLYSWHPERRATRSHIRNAIHYALCEKRAVARRPDNPNETPLYASSVAGQYRAKARKRSVKQLARAHLEYWRYRAFMPGAYGAPGDRENHLRWKAHAYDLPT